MDDIEKEFNLGDIVQFIPENFDFPQWNYRLIGIGYIENIELIKDFNGMMGQIKLYHVYCGRIEKQQMKNFAYSTIENKTFHIIETEIQKVCEVISRKK